MQTPSTPQATSAPTPEAPASQVGVQTISVPANATSHEIYMALRAERNLLVDQRQELEELRSDLRRQLSEGTLSDADRAGLDQRIALTDQQIVAKQISIAESEGRLTAAAAVPGAATPPPEPPGGDVEEMFGFTLFVCTMLAIPIVIAWTRRLWRKSSTVLSLPKELGDRLGSLERAVDSVAVEVERIGEGQRFVTQLLAERASATGRLAAAGDDRQV